MKKKVLRDKSYFYENNFYLQSDISRISKFVVHYEIYKKISKIKGDIFEFGVFKGSSLIRFLSFINLFEKKKKKKYLLLMRLENFLKVQLRRIINLQNYMTKILDMEFQKKN